jgi:hypothetical protein
MNMLADSSPMSCFGGRSDVRERFEAANRVNPIDPVRASEPAGRQPRRGKYQLVPPNRRFPRLAAVPVRSDCFVSSLRVGQMPSWLGRLFFLRLDQLGIRQHNVGRTRKWKPSPVSPNRQVNGWLQLPRYPWAKTLYDPVRDAYEQVWHHL